jgi:hypothetical protein
VLVASCDEVSEFIRVIFYFFLRWKPVQVVLTKVGQKFVESFRVKLVFDYVVADPLLVFPHFVEPLPVLLFELGRVTKVYLTVFLRLQRQYKLLNAKVVTI